MSSRERLGLAHTLQFFLNHAYSIRDRLTRFPNLPNLSIHIPVIRVYQW